MTTARNRIRKTRASMVLRHALAVTLLALLAAAAVAAPPGTDPDTARARLGEIESELAERARHQRELADAASAAGREAEALARRMVAMAAEVQSLEESVAAVVIKTETLAGMLAERERELGTRRRQMAHTLAALQRLTRRPSQLALLRPGDADDTIRGALLLRDLAPRLEAQAADIGQQIRDMILLRDRLAAEQRRLDGELAELAGRRTELDALRARREAEQRALLVEADAERQRMATLAREARDMEELLAGIEVERQRRALAAEEAARRLADERSRVAARPVPPSGGPMSAARGTLPLPARGRLVAAFGEGRDALRRKGITIATLGGARVVAPFDGRIAFAGNFRGYGQLVIIAHGEGFHTLLAGMSAVFADVGQWVLAGEPVGTMADGPAATSADSTTGAPELYIELRKEGEAVDPLPWLAAGFGKVS